ncbi:MAG: hypothetical protein R2759_11205 [Bacteroidales bacterium]
MVLTDPFFIGGSSGIGSTGKVGIGDVTDPRPNYTSKPITEAASLFLETYSFGGSNAADLWLSTQEYGLRAMYGKLYFNTGAIIFLTQPMPMWVSCTHPPRKTRAFPVEIRKY